MERRQLAASWRGDSNELEEAASQYRAVIDVSALKIMVLVVVWVPVAHYLFFPPSVNVCVGCLFVVLFLVCLSVFACKFEKLCLLCCRYYHS